MNRSRERPSPVAVSRPEFAKAGEFLRGVQNRLWDLATAGEKIEYRLLRRELVRVKIMAMCVITTDSQNTMSVMQNLARLATEALDLLPGKQHRGVVALKKQVVMLLQQEKKNAAAATAKAAQNGVPCDPIDPEVAEWLRTAVAEETET